MHMEVFPVPVNTSNAVKEVFPTKQSANNNAHSRLNEEGCQTRPADSSQPGVKSSHNGVNQIDSTGVYSDQSDKQ